MERASALRARLEELRRSFDGTFAEPLADQREERASLLVIRVGREPHAVRLSEVAALEARCAVTPVPSTHPELLGVAGLRGVVAAVFDLGALLGITSGSGGDPPWLLLVRGSAKLAFAFAAFEGVLNVTRAELGHAQTARGLRVREVVRWEGQPLPVIDIAGLAGDLERRPSSAGEEGGG